MWNKLKQWLHPDHITRSSIKEGFDDLPAAVCYFTPDGIIRLCNRQMFRVYRALSGRDLQSLEELHQQVWAPTHGRRVDGKNPSFVLPDGTCWLYSEQTVFGEGVRPHVECIFSEVTDLQRQRQGGGAAAAESGAAADEPGAAPAVGERAGDDPGKRDPGVQDPAPR